MMSSPPNQTPMLNHSKKGYCFGYFITREQKKLLMELVEANLDVFGDPGFGRKKCNRDKLEDLWESFAIKLNTINGPTKTGKEWRKTWQSIKFRIKEKNKYNPWQTDNIVISEDSYPALPYHTEDTVISDDSCNNIACTTLQDSCLDVSYSEHSINQDETDNGDDDEVARRIKDGEEFCGRVIGAVTRMLRKDNRTRIIEDVASMRLITMNKLRFLLAADDCTDRLAPESRMSITDWLLFDTVIVHQDFDVIGMTDTTENNPQVLVDLFELVEKYNVESLAGDQLAEAWAMVTLNYNNDNRQCTPMLLQRRWYQLKLATRKRFYKLWSISEGSPAKLHNIAAQYKPTALQKAIVVRYKSLVVEPFVLWKDLIKNRRVILREQFESIAMNKKSREQVPEVSQNRPASVDTTLENRNTLLINNMETDRLQQENQNSYINKTITFEAQDQTSRINDEVKTNLMEIEPSSHIDETVDPRDRNDAVINELSENHALPIIKSEINYTPTIDDIETFLPFNVTVKHASRVETEPVLPTITNIFGNVHVPIETLPKISELTAHTQNKEHTEINAAPLQPTNVTIANFLIDDVNEDVILNEDPPKINLDSVDMKMNIDNIELSNDLETMGTSLLLDDIIKTEKEEVSIKDALISEDTHHSDDADIKIDINELSYNIDGISTGTHLLNDGIENMNTIGPSTDTSEHFLIEDVLSTENSPFTDDVDLKTFDKLSMHNEDFGDENLLLDDGIMDVPNDTGKMDVDIDQHNTGNEDDSRLDKKLNMSPIVLTVKLDDMGILPVNLLEHVYSKTIIDIINFKSKPVIRHKVTKAKLNTNRKPHGVKRVKLSSALFQKPRTRTYKHFQLCKNPDFYTNLKMLNPNFYISPRNQMLLKSCNPLTVDVSKAFESKLHNGIMYLETNNNADFHNKVDFVKTTKSIYVKALPTPVQSVTDSAKHDVTPVILIIPKVVPDPPQPKIVPYISEIRRINEKLLKPEITPTVKTGVANVPVIKVSTANVNNLTNPLNTTSADNSIPGSASETNEKQIPTAIKDNLKHKILKTSLKRKKVVAEIPLKPSNTLLGLDSLDAMLLVFKDDKEKLGIRTYCCWARERLITLKLKSIGYTTIGTRHSCPYPSCACCCKSILEEYFSKHGLIVNNKQGRLSPDRQKIIENDVTNENDVVTSDESIVKSKQSDKPSNLDLDPKRFNILRDRLLNDSEPVNTLDKKLQNYYDPPPSKPIYLDENQILLTATKFPSNFRRFEAFHHYLKNYMALPKGILNLLPNGRVIFTRDPKAEITTELLTELVNLVNEFNQTKDFKKYEEAPKTIHETKNTNQDLDLIKSHLGNFFTKRLTRITTLSELKYVHSNNGIFFKLDLYAGLLDLINVSVQFKPKAPIENEFILPDLFAPMSPNLFAVESSEQTRSIKSESPELITADPLIANESLNELNSIDYQYDDDLYNVSHLAKVSSLSEDPDPSLYSLHASETTTNDGEDTNYVDEIDSLKMQPIVLVQRLEHTHKEIWEALKSKQTLVMGENITDSDNYRFAFGNDIKASSSNSFDEQSLTEEDMNNGPKTKEYPNDIVHYIRLKPKLYCDRCPRVFVYESCYKKHQQSCHKHSFS